MFLLENKGNMFCDWTIFISYKNSQLIYCRNVKEFYVFKHLENFFSILYSQWFFFRFSATLKSRNEGKPWQATRAPIVKMEMSSSSEVRSLGENKNKNTKVQYYVHDKGKPKSAFKSALTLRAKKVLQKSYIHTYVCTYVCMCMHTSNHVHLSHLKQWRPHRRRQPKRRQLLS